ncbi:MAG: nickel insertion protein [Acidobacteriota bacterium]
MPSSPEPSPLASTTRLVLEADLDDATPELLAAAADRLREAGALDVTSCAVVMKKGRLGQRLTVVAAPEDRDRLLEIVFTETSTLGCRCYPVERFECERTVETVATPFGSIPVKVGRFRGKVVNRKPEHDACVAAARAHDVSLQDVLAAVSYALRPDSDAASES